MLRVLVTLYVLLAGAVWSALVWLAHRVSTSPALWVVLLALSLFPYSGYSLDYPIIYIQGPRYGDDTIARLPDTFAPLNLEPGSHLMLLPPGGTPEVLVDAGPNGAILDPQPSLDARFVYYSHCADVRPSSANTQRHTTAWKASCDLYKIALDSHQIVRLTWPTWLPTPGVAPWSRDPLTADPAGTVYLGYGSFATGPAPLPDGKVLFTANWHGLLPNKNYTWPNLQLWMLDESCTDEQGRPCVEPVGHLNLGGALHPVLLTSGKVMWSSYEGQGLRDKRLWGVWASYPDGREWEPLLSAFPAYPGTGGFAMHFQAQRSDKTLAIVSYYLTKNWGFGTLLGIPPRQARAQMAVADFGNSVPTDPSNPVVQHGLVRHQYSTSPYGLHSLTPWINANDTASVLGPEGTYLGKVTHPASAPGNGLLVVYSAGPVNQQPRPVSRPVVDAGLYLMPTGSAPNGPQDLVLIVNSPAYNEQQPRALVPWEALYGEPPKAVPWVPNDGTVSPYLPPGTPYGLVGTSTFTKRGSAPGRPEWNCVMQGCDAGQYANHEMQAVRILTMEPLSHRSYGPAPVGTGQGHQGFTSPISERLRVLAEIPLRKYTPEGTPVLDVDGNPDTSFWAKIPADVVFTFQTLDAEGLALNTSPTWHMLRPGEQRTNCGGCHAHHLIGTDFSATWAAKQPPIDLTGVRPWLVEYHRDVQPVLQQYAPDVGALTPTALFAGTPPLARVYQARVSPLMAQLSAAPPEARKIVATWIDTGGCAETHPGSCERLETRPTLTVRVHRQPVTCPTGCSPISTTAVLQVGVASVYQDVTPAHLQVSLAGQDVTGQLVPEEGNPGVVSLPLDGTGQGLVIAKVCPATGDCTRARVERRAAIAW